MKTSPTITNNSHLDFNALAAAVRQRFADQSAGRTLFTTDSAGLFEAYLKVLPEDERQPHNCHACRDFLSSYGGLVAIAASGETLPVMWDSAAVPAEYAPAIEAMAAIVRKAKVTGVFYSSLPVWGKPTTGPWTHFAITEPPAYRKSPLKDAGQAMAEKLEDFRMLIAALQEFSLATVQQAVAVLESEALYRSEKCLGVARWLQDLHERRAATKHSRLQQNLTWLAVATAPPGFCHVRSSMIGTLLEDIAIGMPFDEISLRFAAKMNPLQYQRPQAAPSAGNIAQAEKVIAELGLTSSLRRRYARLEDIQDTIWLPSGTRQQQPAEGGVFSHLKPKGSEDGAPALTLPRQTMTWVKFLATVLPEAAKIEAYIPYGHANFAALVTAADPEAPPILQWDQPGKRNPVSLYVYHGGSPASNWGLATGWHPVTAICPFPFMWNGGNAGHHGAGVVFLLAGARDKRHLTCGNALFPEILKPELRGIRSTIEAYSKQAVLEGHEEASACGLAMSQSKSSGYLLQVTSKAGNTATYTIDRWD